MHNCAQIFYLTPMSNVSFEIPSLTLGTKEKYHPSTAVRVSLPIEKVTANIFSEKKKKVKGVTNTLHLWPLCVKRRLICRPFSRPFEARETGFSLPDPHFSYNTNTHTHVYIYIYIYNLIVARDKCLAFLRTHTHTHTTPASTDACGQFEILDGKGDWKNLRKQVEIHLLMTFWLQC